MLDRIDVDVVEVHLEIALVADGMFPIAPLPDSLLCFRNPATGPLGQAMTLTKEGLRERTLDQAHARRIVGIASRQSAEQMDVVRENDLGLESERPATLHLANRVPVEIDCSWVGEERQAVVRDKREEIRRPGYEHTTIAHGVSNVGLRADQREQITSPTVAALTQPTP